MCDKEKDLRACICKVLGDDFSNRCLGDISSDEIGKLRDIYNANLDSHDYILKNQLRSYIFRMQCTTNPQLCSPINIFRMCRTDVSASCIMLLNSISMVESELNKFMTSSKNTCYDCKSDNYHMLIKLGEYVNEVKTRFEISFPNPSVYVDCFRYYLGMYADYMIYKN